ncbi:hypothetical protein FHX64_001983 [Microbacter margulisiae]|uniref:Uncharacterized protein n=1 Tax=Microbacter margulisiae TaxID=1350067 RepID=A0A7W5DS45_9PORP|nr:hypothetical protein [Microbacter margulisiae]
MILQYHHKQLWSRYGKTTFFLERQHEEGFELAIFAKYNSACSMDGFLSSNLL